MVICCFVCYNYNILIVLAFSTLGGWSPPYRAHGDAAPEPPCIGAPGLNSWLDNFDRLRH